VIVLEILSESPDVTTSRIRAFRFVGIGGVDHSSEIQSRISFEIKIRPLSIWVYFHWQVFTVVFWFSEDYGWSHQSMVKTANIHQSKIDVVKFDGTNNFDMW